jgi:hypothetical protein
MQRNSGQGDGKMSTLGFLVLLFSSVNILRRHTGYSVLLIGFVIACLCPVACKTDPVYTHPVSTPAITPSCALTLTATPSLISSTKQKLYDDTVLRYFWLVTHQHYWQMYNMLSTSLQNKEPYNKFAKDPNYVLSSSGGSWAIYQIVVSQQDGRIWNVGVELKFISGLKDNTIWYYWNIHLQKESNHIVFVQFGLYPTGISC